MWRPMTFFIRGLLTFYVKSERVNHARRVFNLMLDKNVICSISMISGDMKQGCVEDAEVIFNRTVEKDVAVYNAMIEGYNDWKNYVLNMVF